MSLGVPGLGETVVEYAGPTELRLDVPARDPEQARQIARDLLSRTASLVADAEAAVGRLGSGYPSSFLSTVSYLRNQNQRALGVVSGEPFAALAEIRRIADDVEQTAAALTAATRGASQRIARIGRIS